MADYTSPKPVDPIWYQLSAYLRIECGCGRRECYQLREFARYHRLPDRMQIYDLVRRLRCAECQKRPWAEVTRYPNGNRK